jgi:branched-chain amino acid transport system substrate-binding protein
MNNNIKKIIGLVVVIAIVLFGIIALTNKDGSGNNNTIRIGIAVPLTGNQGFVGEGIRDAVLLAQSKLNNTKYKYDFVFEDVQVNPQMAASAAQKLINIDKVDAIIDAYAPIGDTIAPIAEKAKVVHINIAFDPRAAIGEYNFIDFTTPNTSVKAFLEEMKSRGLTKLGIFRLNNPGILAVYGAIKELSPEYGISIVSDEQFQPGERDFRDIVTKGTKNKADIYALLSIPPELDILAKQMKDLGIKNQTSVIYFELSPNKSLYEGLWSIGFGGVDNAFEKEFKDTYKRELAYGAPNSYDSVNIIVAAAEAYTGKGKPSATDIANQMANLKDLSGVLGKLSINSDGIIDSGVQVKIVKDGVLVPVK